MLELSSKVLSAKRIGNRAPLGLLVIRGYEREKKPALLLRILLRMLHNF